MGLRNRVSQSSGCAGNTHVAATIRRVQARDASKNLSGDCSPGRPGRRRLAGRQKFPPGPRRRAKALVSGTHGRGHPGPLHAPVSLPEQAWAGEARRRWQIRERTGGRGGWGVSHVREKQGCLKDRGHTTRGIRNGQHHSAAVRLGVGKGVEPCPGPGPRGPRGPWGPWGAWGTSVLTLSAAGGVEGHGGGHPSYPAGGM